MKCSQELRDDPLRALEVRLSLVEKELSSVENHCETLRHKRNALNAAIAIVSENPSGPGNH